VREKKKKLYLQIQGDTAAAPAAPGEPRRATAPWWTGWGRGIGRGRRRRERVDAYHADVPHTHEGDEVNARASSLTPLLPGAGARARLLR
jgi:hypothetical protein